VLQSFDDDVTRGCSDDRTHYVLTGIVGVLPIRYNSPRNTCRETNPRLVDSTRDRSQGRSANPSTRVVLNRLSWRFVLTVGLTDTDSDENHQHEKVRLQSNRHLLFSFRALLNFFT
jgi:hypothetical protein